VSILPLNHDKLTGNDCSEKRREMGLSRDVMERQLLRFGENQEHKQESAAAGVDNIDLSTGMRYSEVYGN
jgi:hypothetical protein